MLKPSLEIVTPSFGNSFALNSFDKRHVNTYKSWHYHPEIELVYINGGSGKRQIGSHVSYFNNGDLILIGSNLPHCGFTDEYTGNEKETLVQIKEDSLGMDFLNVPEIQPIKLLFERAKSGLAFSGKTKVKIGEKMEILEYQSDFQKLMSILNIFHELAQSKEVSVLNASGFFMNPEISDNNRINDVFNYVKNNFQHSISLDEIASIAFMTVPAFCRYFKKVTNKTFTQFVNEYRLVHASKLLSEEPLSVSDIADECGFNNFSHFTKLFKNFTGQSPSTYRKNLKQSI